MFILISNTFSPTATSQLEVELQKRDDPSTLFSIDRVGTHRMALTRFFLLLATLLLSGCSSSDKHEPTLRVALSADPTLLDPRRTADTQACALFDLLYEGLMRVGPRGELEPALAQHIALSDDRQTYTFTLRTSYWSDGTLVTADDFVYAWQTVLDPAYASPFAFKLFSIKNGREVFNGTLPKEALGARALDPRTLQVQLDKPLPTFLTQLHINVFLPIPKHLAEDNSEWHNPKRGSLVSNGPYVMRSWWHNHEMVLERNELYWDLAAIHTKRISLPIVEEEETILKLFEHEDIDLVAAPFASLPLEAIRERDLDERMSIHPMAGVTHWEINTNHPPLNNKKIRRALAMAVDRNAITTHLLPTGFQPAYRLLPDFVARESTPLVKENTQTALRLLQEGMKEEGISIDAFKELVITTHSGHESGRLAQAIQEQWRKSLGIQLKIQALEWKVYVDTLYRGDFAICRSGFVADGADPYDFLENFQFPDSGYHRTGWYSPKFANLLDQSFWTETEEERFALLKEAEELFFEDMPLIPIHFRSAAMLASDKVTGLITSPAGTLSCRYARLTKQT